MSRANKAHVLKLSLHGKLVGYVAGFNNSRNVLSFADAFKNDPYRPTFSLITHPNFPHSAKLMDKPWARNQRLHPTLSNLLPEGSLRALIAQGLKVHADNEFHLLSYLGNDLPGALIAETMQPDDVPDSILNTHGKATAVQFEKITQNDKFSLAGVQMKFSMKEKEGRYNLLTDNELGDWIIKTPSTQHSAVPSNEYTAMTLTALVGIEIPEIKLIDLKQLDNLPPIKLPNEPYAFAIKRFDRETNNRIHMEDFAQVLIKYAHEKYNTANYEQIGQIIYQYSGDGLIDIQQFAKRLLVNILLANGDAHLKNWSLLYTDQVTPRLSPAYDIVTTQVYIDNEKHYALNLAKTKAWYDVSYEHFETWAKRVDVSWLAIKPQLDETLNAARSLWPKALKDLPMLEEHKTQLRMHWRKLHQDFRV